MFHNFFNWRLKSLSGYTEYSLENFLNPALTIHLLTSVSDTDTLINNSDHTITMAVQEGTSKWIQKKQ